MQTVHSRYGNATNFALIITTEGKKHSLGGFSAGTEIVYGFLTNWWNTYQEQIAIIRKQSCHSESRLICLLRVIFYINH